MVYSVPLLEEQMQNERFGRAQAALQRGEMAVHMESENAWLVTSKGNQYTVSLGGDIWACTCPDFTGRCKRFGLLCKHILAVRFSEAIGTSVAGQNGSTHMEETMLNNIPVGTAFPEPNGFELPISHKGQDHKEVDELVSQLRQPLDMSRVKRRQAPGQGTVPYLEGYTVIEAANDLFQFCWSFDLLGEPTVMRWDKTITFYDQHLRKKVPVLGEDGKPTTEVSGICYITGHIVVEIGGKEYGHADVGRCIFNGDAPEALDMALAGAATDCLKRCFRQLGERFGLSLYDKEIAKTAGLENGSSETASLRATNNEPPSARPGLSKSQPASAPPAKTKSDTLEYRDGNSVDLSKSVEVNAFNSFKGAHNGLAPASREVLRAWTSRNNGSE
jgi:hypothetical protein